MSNKSFTNKNFTVELIQLDQIKGSLSKSYNLALKKKSPKGFNGQHTTIAPFLIKIYFK